MIFCSGVEQTHSDFATDDELELGRDAKEKIKVLMLELVGEDEPGKSPIDIGREFSTPRDYKRHARNQLRAALRAKIESL